MGFFCKGVGAFGEIAGPFRMPVAGRVVAFLVVFGGRSVGVCRQFVLFGGLSV